MQALPNSYIEELFARKLAEMEIKEELLKEKAEENKVADTIAKLKAGNAAVLRKMKQESI